METLLQHHCTTTKVIATMLSDEDKNTLSGVKAEAGAVTATSEVTHKNACFKKTHTETTGPGVTHPVARRHKGMEVCERDSGGSSQLQPSAPIIWQGSSPQLKHQERSVQWFTGERA